MSPPPGKSSRPRTRAVVVALALLFIFASALVGTIAVVLRDPKAAGFGLAAAFTGGIVLASRAGEVRWSMLTTGFWIGLFLAIYGLGTSALVVFFGVSVEVAFGVFCGNIVLTVLLVFCVMSPPADDYDD